MKKPELLNERDASQQWKAQTTTTTTREDLDESVTLCKDANG